MPFFFFEHCCCSCFLQELLTIKVNLIELGSVAYDCDSEKISVIITLKVADSVYCWFSANYSSGASSPIIFFLFGKGTGGESFLKVQKYSFFGNWLISTYCLTVLAYSQRSL